MRPVAYIALLSACSLLAGCGIRNALLGQDPEAARMVYPSPTPADNVYVAVRSDGSVIENLDEDSGEDSQLRPPRVQARPIFAESPNDMIEPTDAGRPVIQSVGVSIPPSSQPDETASDQPPAPARPSPLAPGQPISPIMPIERATPAQP